MESDSAVGDNSFVADDSVLIRFAVGSFSASFFSSFALLFFLALLFASDTLVAEFSSA